MTTSRHLIILVCLWPQLKALSIAGGRGDVEEIPTPSFYMMDEEIGQDYTGGFKHHPARVDTLQEADMVVTCCFKLSTVHKFVDLPRRSKAKPYLIMAHDLHMRGCSHDDYSKAHECAVASKIFEEREDFTFFNYDLRDHMLTDNRAPPLPGVTMAPPGYFSGPPLSPLQDPKYFLTFRGNLNDGFDNSSHVRSQIQEAFQKFQSNRVVVEVLPVGHKSLNTGDIDRYNDLMNTSYGLVPHGDNRWSHRFSEVIGACAIPVIISDGLTLPFEELIDWKAAAVVLEEETYMPKLKQNIMGKFDGTKAYLQLLLHPEFLVEQLISNPDQIQEKRRRVCEINDKYFSSKEKRITALLKAAAIRAHR